MAGTSLSVVSTATANRGGVPAWVSTPLVRGKNEVDRKLSVQVSQSMWTYTPTLKWMRPTLSWQWKRNGSPITGATDPVYVTTSSDLGTAITCTVTLTGENGSASVTTSNSIKSLDFNVANPNGTFFTDEATYSNTIGASTISTSYDLVALGVLKSSKTTGSIAARGTSLVVASAAGFTIGDRIIVETGAEAGAGLPGTRGVGGAYPTLYYANAAAMNADTSKPNFTQCWLESTGYVWYWNAAGSSWVQVSTDYFYTSKAVPRALLATITNIVGTTITLDTAAVVAATNANVYFDCVDKFLPYTNRNYGGSITPKRIYISTGEYAFSYFTDLAGGMKDLVFEGDGSSSTIFVAPNGCSNINMQISTVQRSIFRKFGFRGNHKLNTWCRGGYTEDNYVINHITGFASGIKAQICGDTLFDDVRLSDAENQGVVLQVSVDTWIRNCYASFVAPMRSYVGWVFNAADSSNCGVVDCQVDSDYYMPSCEIFGGSSNYMLRFVGRNSGISVNSSTDFYVDTPNITINAGCAYNYQVSVSTTLQNWSPGNTTINLNTNIANQQGRADPTATGTLINPRVVCEGMMNPDVNGRNRPITVAPLYYNVMIKGGYIEVPVQQSVSWTMEGAACDGDGMTVSGTRFVGFSVAGDKGIDAERVAGNGRVVDCIAENITARVNQRNVTNAAYTAAGGS